MSEKKVFKSSEYAMGVVKLLDVRDYKATTTLTEFPDKFTLPMEHMPEPKNQSVVGCCVACAIASVLEYYYHRAYNRSVNLGVGYIYGNRTHGNYKADGMIVRHGLKDAFYEGCAVENDFPFMVEVPTAIDLFEKRDRTIDPYAHFIRISGYYAISDANTLKAHLMNVGPAIIAAPWSSISSVDEDNSITFLAKPDGCHCVMVYGWDEKGWLIQNSWSPLFGEHGRARLPYDFEIEEIWGLQDGISPAIIDESRLHIERDASSRSIYKFINIVLNIGNLIAILIKKIKKGKKKNG